MSNLMAILLQTLAARLGVVTGHDLAQACRAEYSRGLNAVLWVLAEVAIAACDLAEILGTVIALKLAFRHPAAVGLSADRLRHVSASVFAAMGNAASRGCHPGAGRDDRHLFPDPDLPGQARLDGCLIGSAAEPAGWLAVHRDRDPGRDGDAAQPVSAFGAGSDAADRIRRRRASHPHAGIICSTRPSRSTWRSSSTRRS